MDDQPPKAADDLNRYKVVRDEIAHEDNLISARLGWFMASQSFLLTALSIAQGSRPGLPRAAINYLFPLVPVIAIVSNLVILAGVVAGICALRRWRRMLDTFGATNPRIFKDVWIIALGWSAPIGLPLIFLAAWLYLLLAGM